MTTSVLAAALDPRLAWLGRASARLVLVEAGTIDLDDALDDHFVADLLDAIPALCPCHSAHCRHFDRVRLELRQEQSRRGRANPAPRRCEPPQSSIAAYQYLVRLNDRERLRTWLESRPEFSRGRR